ncbi:OmpA family protein [Granulosicoccus antarcticus]|uniref:Peptidoglycan-binding protein ArfA n=1 Tax=Granulosicoccus antarcticus IMCC3135 TaxID=1192854 RepID=A0A2Z2NT12_9GAMM|nr:OmpA family protein [Granulosicoccus antarcticus]ASJ74682.1 Peptidoglycan-binding protein ArfA [Granulosicoccus antarcticus IMCC3135]
MSAPTLHFNLPDAERPSIWPWLIALLCGVCLLFLVAQKLQSIPASLQQQAEQQLASSQLDNLTVDVDGRDLILQGTIDKQLSMAPLIKQLSNIDGVRIVKDDLRRFDAVEAEIQQTQQFLQVLSRINLSAVSFQAGSNSIAAGSETALDQVVQLLRNNPDKRIRIEGHTDDTGPASVNLRLSQERAQAVARYLESGNVSASQMIAKGYGSTQPIADNTTDSGRAKNRRIEISYVH